MRIVNYDDEEYLEKLELEDENERLKSKYKKKSKKLNGNLEKAKTDGLDEIDNI